MTYLDPDLPSRPFVLVDQQGLDHGPFRAELFARLSDGTMVCAGHGGSPLYLRVTSTEPNAFTTLDGTGTAHRYQVVVLEQDANGRAILPPQRPA